jgi:small neutral amino acid transporter SnatA (MarC family)
MGCTRLAGGATTFLPLLPVLFLLPLLLLFHLAASAAIAMTDTNTNPSALQRAAWLRKLYFTRAAFSFAWVALAFTVAKGSPVVASALLVVYPAWDALANLWDARMTGGAKANPTQVANAWMSALVTVAVAVSLGLQLQIILAIFGVWAIVAGLLQLATAIRRRKGDRGAVGDDAERGAVCAGWRVLCGAAGECGACGADVCWLCSGGGGIYFLISALVIFFRQNKEQASGLIASRVQK